MKNEKTSDGAAGERWPIHSHKGSLDLSAPILDAYEEKQATGWEVSIASQGRATSRETVAALRHFVVELLQRYHLEQETLEDFETVLAELLQNAYRANPDAGPCEVKLVSVASHRDLLGVVVVNEQSDHPLRQDFDVLSDVDPELADVPTHGFGGGMIAFLAFRNGRFELTLHDHERTVKAMAAFALIDVGPVLLGDDDPYTAAA